MWKEYQPRGLTDDPISVLASSSLQTLVWAEKRFLLKDHPTLDLVHSFSDN